MSQSSLFDYTPPATRTPYASPARPMDGERPIEPEAQIGLDLIPARDNFNKHCPIGVRGTLRMDSGFTLPVIVLRPAFVQGDHVLAAFQSDHSEVITYFTTRFTMEDPHGRAV